MPSLPSDLRSKLERTVIEARDAAEVGARAALEALAVHHYEPYPHMKPPQRALRNHLRARARQLGDRQDDSGRLAISHLVSECAYEHWHRMLFARFLAENNLLIEPDENMAISLAEAEELAKEQGLDVWAYASRCAQVMLPQIFRPDDPLLQVAFATEHRIKLERLLASLPAAVFTASDALGWVYQFWQSKRKDEVNRSEVKIGADELPAVTQLFTEPYMVEFLLHNTLGAWWAGKTLAAKDAACAKTEDELRAKVALPGVGWEYLRFVRGENGKEGPWRPAAGTFDGWPKSAKEIKVLDPCCGSGHFLVAALHHLVPIRMAEEGLSAAEAVDAVLRDNLHGLEIDERCCQIAAFALAFAAWTFPSLPSPSGRGAGGEGTLGYRELPELRIACTGIGPQCSAEQWLKLAQESGIPMPRGGREPILNGLLNLHHLFSQAPTLGSLIDPTELPRDLIAADFETIQPYLTAIMKAEKADDETRERAIAAAGMVKAADLLAGEYSLVITNVPYLGREKQNDLLRDRFADRHPEAKADLACVMLERCLDFASAKGRVGIVSPQYWLFLPRYKRFRVKILKSTTCQAIAKLGPGAFETITGEVVNASLAVVSPRPATDASIHVVDAVAAKGTAAKAERLRKGEIECLMQKNQLSNPDAVIGYSQGQSDDELLSDYAYCYQGLATSDNSQFLIGFWEVPTISNGWVHFQMSPGSTMPVDGCTWLLHWEDGAGRYHRHAQALKSAGRLGGWKSGHEAWGCNGIAINRMGDLPVSMYSGAMFDCNVAVLIPTKEGDLPWLWAYLSSPDYLAEVRRLNQKTCVTNLSFVKVPTNKAHWQQVAAKKYPDGLPEPESDDPTQWLFHGHPYEAKEDTMLQVAVARLLGYRWPAELDDQMRLSKRARALVKQCGDLAKFADGDGIVCIPGVRGEEPAADRLFALLAACDIEPECDLDDWLRDEFFEEHCKVFHDRPFIWHIWDGRKRDGFHALVNYHKLAEGGGKGRRLLESLTYAYLGEWITRQKDGVKRGEGGAEDRLAAALELQKRLEAILVGEPPFDIFVRWKKLSEQPIGWEPDINDGVRMNIRPFLASDLPGGKKGAGILRCKPNIKWGKDRGKEPERPKDEYPWFWSWDEKTEDFAGGKKFDGNRWNDCHYTNKAKQAARDVAGKSKR